LIISKGYTDGLRVMKKGTTKIKNRHLANFCVKGVDEFGL